MKRRLFYGALLLVLGFNLFVGSQIYFESVQAAEKNDAYPNLKLFTTVLDRVRQDYVDGEKLTYQDLIHGALRGMLSTLDPHSEFMEPVKYDDLKKDTQGEFGGVGIVISIKDSYLTVVSPMEDTPGFRAGILSGGYRVRRPEQVPGCMHRPFRVGCGVGSRCLAAEADEGIGAVPYADEARLRGLQGMQRA